MSINAIINAAVMLHAANGALRHSGNFETEGGRNLEKLFKGITLTYISFLNKNNTS